MARLDGKVAIIVGGATGIGAATAAQLAADGASVLIGDVKTDLAERVAKRIVNDGGTAIAAHCDISDDKSVAGLVKMAVDRFGGVDCVHVNAADLSIIGIDYDALVVSLEIFDRTIAVDLRGHLLCTRHAVPELLSRGGGSIVYTGSGAAYIGEPTRVSYGVAKAGVHALMRHVASRWGKEGIRSNVVSPGLILSETARANLTVEQQDMQLAEAKTTRHGRAEDIAGMVAFLMSKDGEWINGQVITVDGGRTMR